MNQEMIKETGGSEYEPIIREMIRHENMLVHQRMTWLLAFNGLMFAALSFAFGKPGSIPLIHSLCVFGALICVVSYGLVVCANCAMLRLQRLWNSAKPCDYRGPGVIGIPETTPTKFGVFGLFFWGENWIPGLLFAAWIRIYWIVG
ncbi:MAG: hypothetical protein WCL71_08340 [Deltaproteobacteria bacterium]